MDFSTALPALCRALDAGGVRYALMGGFALCFHGAARMTADIDLLAAAADLPRMDAGMSALGYQLRMRTSNVSHYTAPLRVMGAVDCLHAARPHSLGMLERAVRHPFTNGTTVPVLQPEDLIGLKVQAIANDPARREQDMADIRRLARATGGQLNWPLLEEYFSLFDMMPQWHALRADQHASD